MNRSWTVPAIIAVILLLCISCLCLLAFAGAIVYLVPMPGINVDPDQRPLVESSTPVVVRPTPQATRTPLTSTEEPDDPTPAEETALPGETEAPTPLEPDLTPGEVPTDTLQILQNAELPESDLVDLAGRLQGKLDIPPTVTPPPAFEIGAQETFWATNTDDNESFQVEATLRYATEHAYFWIEDGVDYDERHLRDLAETFEQEIFPTNRDYFGSEWSPGVDGDPHLYILFARGLGSNVAGYYASNDEYHPDASEYSNGHEMFFFSADNVELDEEFTYGVLAHEFQHMIHWYRDRNEDTWLNEGFAELASFINGYDVGGHDYSFVVDPDLQLNDWASGIDSASPYYGAAFLFVNYLRDRFGDETTQAVVGEDANGLASIDKVLVDQGVTDPETGEPITADDLFADWVVTNFLNDGRVADGRYAYPSYPEAPQPSETEGIETCPQENTTRDVFQYGADYIRIECRPGAYNLHFEGSVQVGVVPTDPHSGEHYSWSNAGDESNMTLTRTFDFTSHSGPLTLSYWTWYNLEPDYDYAYVEASTDGQTWQILQTPSGTEEDPSGNSYGWGYNGNSGGGETGEWIEESIDLSEFAGEEVQIRFEYVTDAAVNEEGILLDDISVPEIGYATDFETDDGGWEAGGFVRIQNVLPQAFRLSVIKIGSETTVEQYELSGTNEVDIPLEFGDGVEEVILTVSGTTRFTRQKAAYRFSIDR